MRILFSGASSVIGSHVLKRMLDSVKDFEIWCVRHQSKATFADSRVRVVDLDLREDFDLRSLPDDIDQVIHFAGVTHARDPERYWEVNLRGTRRLAAAALARGCRRFVYISTRCATTGAGAYGESKLAAEEELRKLPWDGLLIIRPSEIYGGGGKEGIDKLIALARRWRLTPLLFGSSQISFAPLWVDDFVMIATDEIMKPVSGLRTVELCGPEDLSANVLSERIAKRYRAWRIPVWWPLFALVAKIGALFNFNLVVPDQSARLTCAKTSSAGEADKTGKVRFLVENDAERRPL